MLKRLRNKKGLTLIELIVGMLMMSIIITSVSSVFTPIYYTYVKANELAEVNALLNPLSAEIMSSLDSATEVTEGASRFAVKTGDQAGSKIEYWIADDLGDDTDNGYLWRYYWIGGAEKDEMVLHKGFYRSYTVGMRCEPAAEEGLYVLTLDLYRTDSTTPFVSREYYSRPIGMN